MTICLIFNLNANIINEAFANNSFKFKSCLSLPEIQFGLWLNLLDVDRWVIKLCQF